MSDAAESSAHNRFGVVRIGESTLGIPISHLSEVFHIKTPHTLPNDSELLHGGVELRGQLVPVLNLQFLGNLTPQDAASKLGVIIEHDGKLLAFYVDEVLGITDIDTDLVHSISECDGTKPSLFVDIFPDKGRFVSILNVSYIFQIPGVFATKRPQIDAQAKINKSSPMLTFAAGSALYAVPAVEVYAAVPKQTIHETAITSGHCLGEITYHDRRIPVACPVGILGLGKQTRQTNAAVVILRFPDDLLLGFAVDEIQDIRTFDKTKEAAIPIWQEGTNFFENVSIGANQTQIFVLSLAKFRANPEILAIASLSQLEETAQKTDVIVRDKKTNVIQERERYLIVDARDRYAIPLKHVTSILEPPKVLTRTDNVQRGFLGYFARLGETVALIDLRAKLGKGYVTVGEGQVLLTGSAGAQIGFLVDRMIGIELSEWRERTPNQGASLGGTVVQLGTDAEALVLPYLDLHGVRQEELSLLPPAAPLQIA